MLKSIKIITQKLCNHDFIYPYDGYEYLRECKKCGLMQHREESENSEWRALTYLEVD